MSRTDASSPPPVRATPLTSRTPLDPFRELQWAQVARGWESRREEYAYFIPSVDVEGEIPEELVGTVFRNGPGINEVYGTPLKHYIDGDGIIAAISFLPVTDGTGRKKVHFRSRFVRTEHHVREKEARKFLYRGQMGTQSTSKWRDTFNTAKDVLFGTITPLLYRNPSNTNVFYWGGKLLSLYETGLPYTLDPRTLMTLGMDDLGGALTHGTMAAHFRFDARRDRLVVISLRPGLRKGSVIAIAEFDRQWTLLQKQVHRIPSLNYAHDFVLTEHFYVFHVTPFVKITRESVYQVATGVSSPGEQMKYYPDLPSRMVVVPRDVARQTEYRTFDVTPCHIFHFGTSKEVYADGTASGANTHADAAAPSPSSRTASSVRAIEFSAVCLPTSFAMFPLEHGAFLSNCDSAPAHLCYFRLPFGQERERSSSADAGVPIPRVECTLLDASSCEFPSTHPEKHGVESRYTWMMANARGKGLPFRDVVKVDEVEARNAAAAHASAAPPKKAPPVTGACASSSPSVAAASSASPPPSASPTRKVWFSHGICGEPIFMPRRPSGPASSAPSSSSSSVSSAEDDGWIFVQVYVPERHTTDFVILDARDPQKGPLAIIHLKHHVTYGFHGTFTPCVFGADSVDGMSVREAAPPELRAKL